MEKPILEEAKFTFSQKGNCVGSTKDIETLTIGFESSLGLDSDEDGYFVLKTDGWSVDSVEDLQEMFDRIKRISLSRLDTPPNEALFNASEEIRDRPDEIMNQNEVSL